MVLPEAVRTILSTLGANGHASFLVGGCVRDHLSGEPVRDYDVATPATPHEVLALFPCAIPIGLRHGTVMVPTPCGPVDVTSFRGAGGLHSDLGHRDFTINAMAFDPATESFVDPFEGRADLLARRLRAVGSAADRLGEDPLRALRAVRFLSEGGFEPDAELVAAMGETAAALPGVAGERLRAELERTLLGRGVRSALALLRRTGLEAALAPGTSERAAARVEALPPDRDLRLAGWLAGTDPGPVLARLRCSRAVADRVARWLRAHPLRPEGDPGRPADVRRLLQKHGEDDLAALLALARATEPAGAQPLLAEWTEAVDGLADAGGLVITREDLALDGQAVMEAVGGGPGPVVGEALRYLLDCVLEEPSQNTPENLRALLAEWREARP